MLSDRFYDITADLSPDHVKDAKMHQRLAQMLSCARVLKLSSLDPSVLETAKYCREYNLCRICEWNRGEDFADRRVRAHDRRSRDHGSITGKNCFEFIIHYQPSIGREHSASMTKHAWELARRFRAECKAMTDTSLGLVTIFDCLTGIHVKRTPHAAFMQPHLHCLVLASLKNGVTECLGLAQDWFDKEQQAAEIAACGNPAAPRLRIMEPEHLGRVVRDERKVSRSNGRVISAVKVRNKFAYTIRRSEKDDIAGEAVTRLELFNESGIPCSFKAFQIGAGRSAGPNEFKSDRPLLVLPFAGTPRIAWPRYQKQVIAAIKTDALWLVEAHANKGGSARPKLRSTIPEEFLAPPSMSLAQANLMCRRNR